jgi:adenylate cyclase
VWESEGIINKFIGDAVLAIFNFPLVREDHAKNAVKAGIELQRQCRDLLAEIGMHEGHELGVGVGIHTGSCNMGEVGNSYKDFTAIGPMVNLAARLQGAAKAGEVLITQEVFEKVKGHLPDLPTRALTLKGIDGTVNSHVIGAREIAAFGT